MTSKRTNITSSIKKQLNGQKPKTMRLDTQNREVLEYLEAQMLYNADKYTKVDILGVEVIVKIGDDDEH
jgi:hypothetical protein